MSFSSARSPQLGASASPSFGTTSPSFNAAGSAFSSPRMGSAEMNAPRRIQAHLDDDEDEELDKPSKPLPVEVSEDGGVEVKGDDGQRLAFRQGAISIEQVRRLAMQSAFRSGLAS